ncbi:MAG: Alpha-glucosidase [Ilumatobacteraceae bacterium]|nr:Alpha-glucosidase [Ilumatobacteraceae bacterium]
MAGRPWWVDATVYQIYVRSFADSNGDGRGDLDGIISHLDHLVDLGVDALWMTPCYPSPQLDHGYDVADYFDIEPTYGSLDTFDQLVAACRQHGLRVLMDVVPNHCSDHHAWFQAALRSPAGSHERSRFYFRDGLGPTGQLPPNNWQAIFGGPAWSRTTDPDGTPGQWYLHTFTPWQPDFDWDSPDVVEHFDRMLRFWFDRGVDGFRIDAVTVLGKAPGLPDAPAVPAGVAETAAAKHNPYTVFWPSAHDVWRHWRTLIDTYERDHLGRELVSVGEAYTPRRPDLLLDYVRADEFHQAFCFDLMLCPFDAAEIRTTIRSVIEPHVAAGAALTWTLNNHDVQRALTRYGRADAASPDSWTGNNLVYTGTPVDLAVGTRRARAMICFVAALPGALYLYQGEELGLPEVLDLPIERRQDPIVVRTEGRQLGRDGCRIPLPWTGDASTSFGFSPTEASAPHEPWLPQPPWWGTYALQPQLHDPASMMSLYREVLAGRRTLDPATELEWAIDGDDDLLAFRRGDVLIVLNPSNSARTLPPSLVEQRVVGLSSVHGHDDPTTVPADACVWLVSSSPA